MNENQMKKWVSRELREACIWVLVLAVLMLTAAVALSQPQAPPVEPLQAPEVQLPKVLSYEEAMKFARKHNVPVVVFVGAKHRDLYAVTCYTDKLEGYTAPCIVVTKKGGEYWHETLSAIATDDEIVESLQRARTGKGKAVEPVKASPFQRRFFRLGEVPRADGDEDISGLLTFLKELEPYSTATMTQHSERRERGWLGPAPRNQLENVWRVPGGLDGVRGWSSQLLKSRNAVAAVGLIRQPTDTITWGRSYPDQSVFADVLRNADGRVFEVRVAEKHDGKWDRYVAYKNHQVAPTGFRRFRTNQCAECHDRAGESSYGALAIPGGDTILSDPYDNLEAGQEIQDGSGVRSFRVLR